MYLPRWESAPKTLGNREPCLGSGGGFQANDHTVGRVSARQKFPSAAGCTATSHMHPQGGSPAQSVQAVRGPVPHSRAQTLASHCYMAQLTTRISKMQFLAESAATSTDFDYERPYILFTFPTLMTCFLARW